MIVLKEKLMPNLLKHNIVVKVTFMQDGSPTHLRNKVMKIQKEPFLKEQLISRNSQMNGHTVHQASHALIFVPCILLSTESISIANRH